MKRRNYQGELSVERNEITNARFQDSTWPENRHVLQVFGE
jgi:hypothetical protein